MNMLALDELAFELYEQGEYKQAFDKFVELAITHNDAYAMQHVALMYASGEGVEQDFDASVEWDKKSIETGNVTAMANIAITYRMMGDIVQAKYWFEKSIEAGEIDSALPLAKLYMVSDKEGLIINQLLQKLLDEAENNPESVCEEDVAEATQLLAQFVACD